MFTISKMDYCMSEVTSERVNKSIQKVHVKGLLGKKCVK